MPIISGAQVVAVVGGLFGAIIAIMVVSELAVPVKNQAASPAITQQAEARAGNAVAPEPAPAAQPRKLQIRAELFEKCHRELVEWKASTAQLRKEIRLIAGKAKEGDEKALVELFKKAADKLDCKAILVGLAGVAEAESRQLASQTDKTVVQMAMQTPIGIDAVAWRDRRLVKPTSDDMFAKLKNEIPGIELIQGQTTTLITKDTYTPYYISYPEALKEIEEQILAVEGAIDVALSE
jgi:hypothetical protein